MSKARLAIRETAAPTLALLTSLSTLVCCTLPAVLITLGMGAALSSLTSTVPQLIWLSEHKPFIFGGSLILLSLAWSARHLTRNKSCPSDPALAKSCARLRKLGGQVLYLGFAVWVIGAFTAFVLPKIIA